MQSDGYHGVRIDFICHKRKVAWSSSPVDEYRIVPSYRKPLPTRRTAQIWHLRIVEILGGPRPSIFALCWLDDTPPIGPSIVKGLNGKPGGGGA